MRWDRPPMFDATVSLPAWVRETVDFEAPYETDEARMRLAIRLADENVRRETGGPIGAAVFERGSGLLISVGVNSVVRLNNCTLHAVWNADATRPRTHLICDFVPTPGLLDLLARGERGLGRLVPEVEAHFAGMIRPRGMGEG